MTVRIERTAPSGRSSMTGRKLATQWIRERRRADRGLLEFDRTETASAAFFGPNGL
jgi:hypothetical protein